MLATWGDIQRIIEQLEKIEEQLFKLIPEFDCTRAYDHLEELQVELRLIQERL